MAYRNGKKEIVAKAGRYTMDISRINAEAAGGRQLCPLGSRKRNEERDRDREEE